MKKSILTLGIAAVLTGVLATCSMAYAADDELAQIQESGKLKVGVEGTYPPYTYHDDNGELTGFDVEVAKAIADKLGVANTATTAYLDILADAGASLVQISTADEAVSLIESGRADFTTFNSVVFNEYLQQHPDANLKVAFVIPDVVDTYAVPIKKGETALYDAVQNAIDELKEDGTDFTQPQDENADNTDTASEDASAESTDEN